MPSNAMPVDGEPDDVQGEGERSDVRGEPAQDHDDDGDDDAHGESMEYGRYADHSEFESASNQELDYATEAASDEESTLGQPSEEMECEESSEEEQAHGGEGLAASRDRPRTAKDMSRRKQEDLVDLALHKKTLGIKSERPGKIVRETHLNSSASSSSTMPAGSARAMSATSLWSSTPSRKSSFVDPLSNAHRERQQMVTDLLKPFRRKRPTWQKNSPKRSSKKGRSGGRVARGGTSKGAVAKHTTAAEGEALPFAALGRHLKKRRDGRASTKALRDTSSLSLRRRTGLLKRRRLLADSSDSESASAQVFLDSVPSSEMLLLAKTLDARRDDD
jgi:hypothetical protein